jgi:hypothetical protein
MRIFFAGRHAFEDGLGRPRLATIQTMGLLDVAVQFGNELIG